MRHHATILAALAVIFASGLAAQITFVSGDISQAIPDNNVNGTTHTINIPATANRIGSYRIGIRIDHANESHLDIYLVPPWATWSPPYTVNNEGSNPSNVPLPPGVIELSTDNGNNTGPSSYGTGTNFTFFSRNGDPNYSTTTQIAGATPGNNTYLPEGIDAFHDIYGRDPSGDWTIVVADDTAGSTGTLIRWRIDYFAIQNNSLFVRPGFENDPGAPVKVSDAGFTASNQVLGQYRFEAFGANSTLTSLTFTGTVNFNTRLTQVAIVADTAPLGVYNGETVIATAAAPAAATVTFGSLSISVPGGSAVNLLFIGTGASLSTFPTTPTLGVRINQASHISHSGGNTLRGFFGPTTIDAGLRPFETRFTTTRRFAGPLDIPDNNSSGVTDSLTVASSPGPIIGLRVGLRLSHTYDADLAIWLLPPGVTWAGPYNSQDNGPVVSPPPGAIELSTQNGGAGDNYGTGTGVYQYTNFSSAPAVDSFFGTNTAITSGTAPFAVAAGYQPEGIIAFNSLYSQSPVGDWTIIVADGWAQDRGFLIAWQLEFVPLQPPAQRLFLNVGPANDPGAPIVIGANDQVVGQLEFSAYNVSPNVTQVQLNEVSAPAKTLTSFTSAMRLYRDNNNDGLLDGGDTLLSTGNRVGTQVTFSGFTQAVATGTAVRMIVVADILASVTAPNQLAFQVTAAANVTASFTVTAAFPVRLGAHPIVTETTFYMRHVGGAAIPDGGTSAFLSTINIPRIDEFIAGLRVGVRIDHSLVHHLDIYLIPPGVTWAGPYNVAPPAGVIELSTDNGGTGTNYGSGPLIYGGGPNVFTFTQFSSNAANDPNFGTATLITAGTAPFTAAAHYQPEGLTAWNTRYNTNPFGDWTLVVHDDTAGTVGRLIAWSIEYVRLQRSVVVREDDPSTGPTVANGATAANGRDFGNQDVSAGATTPLTLYVKNTGTAAMTVGVPTLGGTHPGDYVLNTTGYLTSIPAGSSTSFTVAFDPTTTGARNATVSFTHNGQNTTSPFTFALTGTGIASGALEVRENALAGTLVPNGDTANNARAFGNRDIAAGPSANLTIFVVNTGGTVLTLGVPTIGGSHPGEFNLVTTGFLTSLGPGANTTFTVSFDPSTVGLKSAIISFIHDASNEATPFTFSLSGTGISPEVTVRENDALTGTLVANGAAAANGRAFGNRDIAAGPSATLTVHVINSGSNTLTPGTPALGGANPGEFVLDTTGFSASLAPGASTSFTLAFDPSTTGAKSATVSFAHNGSNEATPFTFSLSGTGISPEVTVRENDALTGTLVANGAAAANGRAFGAWSVVMGPTPTLTIYVINSGSNTLVLAAPVLGAGDTGDFVLDTTGFSTSVAPGASTSFTVAFDPASTGLKSATISFAHNGSNEATPFDFDVSGDGLAPPSVSIAGTSNFGSIALGFSSTPQLITISNTGGTDLTITDIQMAGANPGDWSLTPDNPATLPGAPWVIGAGGSATLFATFTPAASGVRNATIEVTSDTGGTPGTVTPFNVTGSGQFAVTASAGLVGPDTGGPVLIRVTLTGSVNTLSDLRVEYRGGSVGIMSWSSSAYLSRVSDPGATIAGNLIQAIDVTTSGVTIDILWDAYATERHRTASDYSIRLTPTISGVDGTPIVIGPFVLERQGAWVQHIMPSGNITGRFGHAAVYQKTANADRMVVFGGKVGAALVNDLWAYDQLGGEPGWRMIGAAGAPPTARQYHSAIYVPSQDRMIVFGGRNGNTHYNDLWELDLTPGSETWTQLSPSGSLPGGRNSATFLYDSHRNRAILFGGHNGGVTNDVWELDLTLGAEAWTQITPSGTPPTARYGPQAALQPFPTDRMVIYGGLAGSGTMGDVWVLTLDPGNEAWTQITPTNGPGGGTRFYGTHTYDPVRNALISVSGYRGGTVLRDAWLLDLTAGAESWVAMPEDAGASDGRIVGSAVYDNSRSEALFFGGLGVAGTGLTHLSILPSAGAPQWQLPTGAYEAAMPAGRWGAGMIYDPVNSRTVLFAGKDSINRFNDVWAVDPASATPLWTKLNTTGTAPSPRVYSMVIYDSNFHRMIVFGGQPAAGTPLNDLWELDLATLAWTQLSPAGGPPPARHSGAAAYDATGGAQRMFVHGGNGASGLLGDVWSLNLSTRYSETWTQWNPGPGPAPRTGHGAVYNSVLEQFVIYMGSTGVRRNDVWAMDVSGGLGTESWADITPALGPPAPSARYYAAYTSDSAGLTAFVQGGDAGSLMNDLWRLDLSGFDAVWAPVSATNPPLPRSVHSACYDNANNRLVVGLGLTLWPCSDIWTVLPYAGTPVWSQVNAVAAPTAMVNASVCYDPAFNRMIAFGGIESGGFGSQVWQLDLASPVASWSKLPTSGPTPAGRRAASLVFDSVAGTPRMIMYGGWLGTANSTITNQIWQLSLAAGSGTWTNITPAPAGGQPGGRANHAAVFDPIGNRMVIFGGQTSAAFVNTVFALSLGGSPAWSLVSTSGTAPTGRMGMGYTFIPTTRRLVIVGGYNGGTTFADMFFLDLATHAWSSFGGTLPPKRYYNSLVYDSANDRLLMFGGYDTAAMGDLWRFSFGSNTWSQLGHTVALPQTRWAHGAVWDPGNNRMVLSGGYIDGELPSVQSNSSSQLWFWGD